MNAAILVVTPALILIIGALIGLVSRVVSLLFGLLFAVVGLAWILVQPFQHAIEVATGVSLPIGFAAGSAVAGGVLIGWNLRSFTQIVATERIDAAVLAACLLLGAVAGFVSPTGALRGLLAGLFAGLALIAGRELREALRSGQVEFRSAWGGLGGDLGGWEITRPAVLLIGLLFLSGGALVAALPSLPPINQEKPKADADKSETAKPDAAKPDAGKPKDNPAGANAQHQDGH